MTETMTLYTLSQAFRDALEECIDPETGEIVGDLAPLHDAGMTLAEKADNTVMYIRGQRAFADAAKSEAKRIQQIARSAEANAQRVREYAALCIEEAGGSIKTMHGTLYATSSRGVDILDEDAIPDEYCDIKRVPSKTRIKKAIESGIEVPGAAVTIRKGVGIR